MTKPTATANYIHVIHESFRCAHCDWRPTAKGLAAEKQVHAHVQSHPENFAGKVAPTATEATMRKAFVRNDGMGSFADMEDLVSQWTAEKDALEKRLNDIEEAEASCCPEDVSFVEYIGRLEALRDGRVPEGPDTGATSPATVKHGIDTYEAEPVTLDQPDAARPSGDLCEKCEGNGTLPIYAPRQRIGIQICPQCNGRAWADRSLGKGE